MKRKMLEMHWIFTALILIFPGTVVSAFADVPVVQNQIGQPATTPVQTVSAANIPVPQTPAPVAVQPQVPVNADAFLAGNPIAKPDISSLAKDPVINLGLDPNTTKVMAAPLNTALAIPGVALPQPPGNAKEIKFPGGVLIIDPNIPGGGIEVIISTPLGTATIYISKQGIHILIDLGKTQVIIKIDPSEKIEYIVPPGYGNND